MSQLASSVGKALVPHLKGLFGPWWLTAFDPYADVAAAAKRSLQDTFPGKKQGEALMYARWAGGGGRGAGLCVCVGGGGVFARVWGRWFVCMKREALMYAGVCVWGGGVRGGMRAGEVGNGKGRVVWEGPGKAGGWGWGEALIYARWVRGWWWVGVCLVRGEGAPGGGDSRIHGARS